MKKFSFGLVLLAGISAVAGAESLDTYPLINDRPDPIPFQEIQPPPMPLLPEEKLPPMPMMPPAMPFSTPPIVLGSSSGSKHPVAVAAASSKNDSEQLLQLLQEQQKSQEALFKDPIVKDLKAERDARLKKKKAAQDQYDRMVMMAQMQTSANNTQIMQMLQAALAEINRLSVPGTKETELRNELARFEGGESTSPAVSDSIGAPSLVDAKLREPIIKALKAEREARIEKLSAAQNQRDQFVNILKMGMDKQADASMRMQEMMMLQSISAQVNKLKQPGEKERELDSELSRVGGE